MSRDDSFSMIKDVSKGGRRAGEWRGPSRRDALYEALAAAGEDRDVLLSAECFARPRLSVERMMTYAFIGMEQKFLAGAPLDL